MSETTNEIGDRCLLCGARDSEREDGACLAEQRSERDGSLLPCPAAPEAEMHEGSGAYDDLALTAPEKFWPAVAAERERRTLRKVRCAVQAVQDSGLVERRDWPCGAPGCGSWWGHPGEHDRPDLGRGAGRQRADAWIQTASGRVFKPWAPDPKQVTIEDVAHSLSHLCRFNGHCRFLYTVGQHSRIVSDAARSSREDSGRLALLGLLHDAAEAYVGDVVSPIKRHARDFFGPLEACVMAAI